MSRGSVTYCTTHIHMYGVISIQNFFCDGIDFAVMVSVFNFNLFFLIKTYRSPVNIDPAKTN